MFLYRAVRLAALFLFLTVSAGTAQDVTLTSRDGAVEISGTLLGFDGEFYRVKTIYGELTVDGSGVLCDGPACPNLTDYVARIAISGSATMGDVLMPALIEAFALRNGYSVQRVSRDNTRFDYLLTDWKTGQERAVFSFHVTNSDQGFADLMAGEADIAMSMREIRPDEARMGVEAGLGDLSGKNRSRVVGLDALVAVTAEGNPVRAIAPDALARVFAGEVANWADLGGPDAPISLHLLGQGSGITQAVEDMLMAPARLHLAGDINRHDSLAGLSHAVLRDPFALAIAPSSATGNLQVLDLTGACGFSLRASRRAIKTEDYPLTAPMFIYLPARRLPQLARDFLVYTRSPSAQIVVRRAGFVDQAPEEVPVALQGNRFVNAIEVAGGDVSVDDLKRMAARLKPMKRLTTSFRFEAGSSRLDAQSRSNVEQLARALETGRYDARELLFVGFSDGDGPAAANLEIARKRAQTVMEAVVAAAQTLDEAAVRFEADAFGEAMPMACDDSAWGRSVNRRVEVWVR